MTCPEHNEFLGEVQTRLVSIEGKLGNLDDRMDHVERSLAGDRTPCNKVVVVEANQAAQEERIRVLEEFKDHTIGSMATHTTQLNQVQGDVTEMKGDVKKLVKSDTKNTIYWGLIIATFVLAVQWVVPYVVKKLAGG